MPTKAEAKPGNDLPKWLVMVFALSCGVGVANIYFPQAITPSIAAAFDTAPDNAALIVVACQLGYAIGLVLLVPLADKRSPRTLIPLLFFVAAASLLVAGLAQSLPLVVAASLSVGISTVAPQAIVPIAAGMASQDRRALVTGQITAGIGGGILLARAFSGLFGAWWGWRAPYVLAAVMALLLATALLLLLPKENPNSTQVRYFQLIISPLRMFQTHSDLRRSCYYQASVFAAFNAAWTPLALYVTGPHFRQTTATVGLIALAGAVSLVVAPLAGKLVSTRGSNFVTVLSTTAALLAGIVLLGGLLPGWLGLGMLILGITLLDASVPASQVANQMRVFAIDPTARARANTAYMACTFIGGAIGSWVGVHIYQSFGWLSVCAAVIVTTSLTLIIHQLHRAAYRQ